MVVALLVGLVALGGMVYASDRVVAAGRRIARRAGMSDLAIGLTLTSVGTSLPELATTVSGAIEAHGAAGPAAGVAAGNLLGSNLFVLGGLLGGTALVRAFPVDVGDLRRDGGALAVATALAVLAAGDGQVSRGEGMALLAVFVAWLAVLARDERTREAARDRDAPVERPTGGVARDVAGVVLGLAGVLGGAALLVERGVAVATGLGVHGEVVGLWVGVGTSLPEVVVSIQAARQGSTQVAFGNVLGSAITNFSLCLGLGALAVPLSVQASPLDAAFLALTTATALLLLANHRELSRAEGAVLALLFVTYAALRSVAG